MTEPAAWVTFGISAAALPEEARWWTRGLWIVLVAVWVVGAFMTRQTARQQTSNSRLWQMGIVLLGMWLLFGQGTGFAWMDEAAFPMTEIVTIAGLATTLAGVAFAIWARATLGANWSGVITVKVGHNLVRRGPYRIVRHPIYTGLLIAVAGTALTYGSIRGILSLPIVAFGLWLKTLTEERFMVQEFGEEYLCYKREVRALVPFLF
jgi:protein-S-isoprenylcysteine O-methyltransferase Ste14